MKQLPLHSFFVRILILSLLCLWRPAIVLGQLSGAGHPMPLQYHGAPVLQINTIMVSEEQKNNALETDDTSNLKSAKSGLLLDVTYSPDNCGTWDTLTDGMKIWRTAIRVPGSNLINVLFSPYTLNKGAKVFLYDLAQKTVLGAFTDRNNKFFNRLATANIPGEVVVIELQVPEYLGSAGSFGISGVGCDFSGGVYTKSTHDEWFGASANCNLDINCNQDTLIQMVKNAVVRIVFSGTERCTGTLLNNTRKDGRHYLITAEHCIDKEALANTAVFYFNYESPYCSGPDGSNHKTLSGATMRATGVTLDFTLLELLEPIPFIYKPFYAGWDYTANPPSSGAIIHHPYGDVKKISAEEDDLLVANYGSGYNSNTHWLVRHWESGTTEKGSSGGAFFDTFGRVTGTLTGGIANCTTPINDYFQMFSHCWDDYPQLNKQLACWLDPLELQEGFLNGFDPFSKFWKTGDTLSNILETETLTTESPGLTWGSYTGHNSLHLSGFAEKFTIQEEKGMLGMMIDIANNHVAVDTSTIHFMIWEGTDSPTQVVYEKSVPLADLSQQALNFIEFDSVVWVNPVFFAGYSLEYNLPQDTFSVYMAENRLSEPFHTAFIFDYDHWQSLADFSEGTIHTSIGIYPVVFDSIPEDPYYSSVSEDPWASNISGRLIAWPNPSSQYLWLEFKDISPYPLQIKMVNMQGITLMEKDYGPYQRIIPLDIDNLDNGIYLIRVKEGNFIHNLKVTIMK